MEAVEAFLRAAPEFEVDGSRERFMLTLNPGGFLKRVG
jgi:cephalosporin hydroxylase